MRILGFLTLGLLYISLGIMYLLLPPNGLLWALGGIILIAGIVLTMLGGQRYLTILGVITLLASISAMALLGSVWAGAVGILILPLLWMGIIYAGASWAWRSTIFIQSGTIMIVSHPFGEKMYRGPIQIRPLLPFLEEELVRMPVYELVSHVSVETINTRALQNIPSITLEIRYQVSDPVKLLQNLPNRAHLLEGVATGFDLTPDRAMLRTAFWERLLDDQIKDISDNLLRTIIYEHINRAVDGSSERQMLATILRERIYQLIERWGVTIHALDIESVNLDPEQIKRSKRDMIIKREFEDAERQARIEAQKIEIMGKAQAAVQAHAIEKWIAAIQQPGVSLSANEIEQIVFNALEELHNKYQRVELFTGMKNPVTNGYKERVVGE